MARVRSLPCRPSYKHFTLKNKWIIDYTANALADDLERLKPEVVFTDSAVMSRESHAPVDLPAYFSAYPAFKATWRYYRYARGMDYCGKIKEGALVPNGCKFDVYHRIAKF